MSLLVEDTSRNNLVSWTVEARASGYVEGAIVSPFSTPVVGTSFKPSGARIASDLVDGDASVWFDPATHALQMPGVGDFRYYDDWDLWGGARGDLLTTGLQRDHVLRVLDRQDSLGARPLGPTTLLSTPAGAEPALAFSLAELALDAREDAWVTIAGTSAFWSSGAALDTYIGAIAQLGAEGVFVAVVRPTADMPVAASSDEIAGLCRTVRSLSEYGPVHVSHGDLAGLPGVSAGATSLGTGWDLRQRVCSFTSYEARDPSLTFGSWFQRPTYQGLLACLARSEAERLFTQDQALSAHLHPGQLHPDGPKEAFMHHVSALANLDGGMSGLDYEGRFRFLEQTYSAASAEWPGATALAAIASSEQRWIGPLYRGLVSYGQAEGWV